MQEQCDDKLIQSVINDNYNEMQNKFAENYKNKSYVATFPINMGLLLLINNTSS